MGYNPVNKRNGEVRACFDIRMPINVEDKSS